MQTFTRTAAAVVLSTLATAAGAQGYMPPLVGLKPPVVGTHSAQVSPGTVIGAGLVRTRAEAETIRAQARAHGQAARAAAAEARAAARAGR